MRRVNRLQRTRARRFDLLLPLIAGCASPGTPPGGHVDRVAPALVSVTPDTNSLNVRQREVVFRFNKVVSERPASAQDLQQLVVVSPSDGPANVDWRRDAIAVRPRRGWRAGTGYSVTILPGLADLYGNATTRAIRTEFSTGAVIPRGSVRGVAFDWVAQAGVRAARVEATIGGDTTFRYIAVADSGGRFTLPSLPPGTFLLRIYKDDNSSRALDRREAWDSATVPVVDSARRDFYLFVHDSLPRITSATASDSLTVRVVFDKPLHPDTRLDPSRIVLSRRTDSSRVEVRRVVTAAEYDSLLSRRRSAAADSTARADTSVAARRSRARADSLRAIAVADSIARAQVESVRALRDTVARDSLPRPQRPAPITSVVVELGRPLISQDGMLLEVRDVRALAGPAASPRSTFFWRRPVPPKDSTAGKAPRDSTVRKAPGDSTVRKGSPHR